MKKQTTWHRGWLFDVTRRRMVKRDPRSTREVEQGRLIVGHDELALGPRGRRRRVRVGIGAQDRLFDPYASD